MNRIAIITSTRAEFGLLLPLIIQLKKYENENFKCELVVTGTHLSYDFGHTIDEIYVSGVAVNETVNIPVNSVSELDISHNQSVTIDLFSKLFYEKKYAGIVILGDRYEMLAIAIAAGNTRTPIIHLCGGDTTEGAMDEWIRHSITKMSYLHFPSNLESYRRVIQLGESPDRVFNYGSTSIDNIVSSKYIDYKDVLNSLGLPDCRYAICTYHPITMENDDLDELIKSFVEAIKQFPSIRFIITKSNADFGGEKINRLLDKYCETVNNIEVYTSLGVNRYLSLMKNAEFVLGNSSSGIIEAPVLHIPTVNIGSRQQGRLRCASIVDCKDDTESIVNAIRVAMSAEHKRMCDKVVSPYGEGNAAVKIAEKIYSVISNDDIDLRKKFYMIGNGN